MQTQKQARSLHSANDYVGCQMYTRRMAHSRPKRYTNWYLREWMATLNVTQADLVERTELGKTAISLLCDDRQDYRPTIVRDIALALNISAYELLMDPSDAMALRQLRKDAVQVVRTSEALERTAANDRTGTEG